MMAGTTGNLNNEELVSITIKKGKDKAMVTVQKSKLLEFKYFQVLMNGEFMKSAGSNEISLEAPEIFEMFGAISIEEISTSFIDAILSGCVNAEKPARYISLISEWLNYIGDDNKLLPECRKFLLNSADPWILYCYVIINATRGVLTLFSAEELKEFKIKLKKIISKLTVNVGGSALIEDEKWEFSDITLVFFLIQHIRKNFSLFGSAVKEELKNIFGDSFVIQLENELSVRQDTNAPSLGSEAEKLKADDISSPKITAEKLFSTRLIGDELIESIVLRLMTEPVNPINKIDVELEKLILEIFKYCFKRNNSGESVTHFKEKLLQKIRESNAERLPRIRRLLEKNTDDETTDYFESCQLLLPIFISKDGFLDKDVLKVIYSILGNDIKKEDYSSLSENAEWLAETLRNSLEHKFDCEKAVSAILSYVFIANSNCLALRFLLSSFKDKGIIDDIYFERESTKVSILTQLTDPQFKNPEEAQQSIGELLKELVSVNFTSDGSFGYKKELVDMLKLITNKYSSKAYLGIKKIIEEKEQELEAIESIFLNSQDFPEKIISLLEKNCFSIDVLDVFRINDLSGKIKELFYAMEAIKDADDQRFAGVITDIFINSRKKSGERIRHIKDFFENLKKLINGIKGKPHILKTLPAKFENNLSDFSKTLAFYQKLFKSLGSEEFGFDPDKIKKTDKISLNLIALVMAQILKKHALDDFRLLGKKYFLERTEHYFLIPFKNFLRFLNGRNADYRIDLTELLMNALREYLDSFVGGKTAYAEEISHLHSILSKVTKVETIITLILNPPKQDKDKKFIETLDGELKNPAPFENADAFLSAVIKELKTIDGKDLPEMKKDYFLQKIGARMERAGDQIGLEPKFRPH